MEKESRISQHVLEILEGTKQRLAGLRPLLDNIVDAGTRAKAIEHFDVLKIGVEMLQHRATEAALYLGMHPTMQKLLKEVGLRDYPAETRATLTDILKLAESTRDALEAAGIAWAKLLDAVGIECKAAADLALSASPGR